MDEYYRKLLKALFQCKAEMLQLGSNDQLTEQHRGNDSGNLFQLSRVGLKTNALLKEHAQVLAVTYLQSKQRRRRRPHLERSPAGGSWLANNRYR